MDIADTQSRPGHLYRHRSGGGKTRNSFPRRLERVRSAGFTLFEIMIAVAIFAILGLVAFTGLNEMTRKGQSIADANLRLSELQFAVVYFVRDWTQVSPRGIRNQYGDPEANIVIDEGAISFTRSGWVNPLGRQRSTLQRVQYLLDEDRLVRRHWPSIDQGIGEEPLESVLLDGVQALEIEFFDAEGEPIGDWPPEEGQEVESAPVVLSFQLELDEFGEIRRVLEIPDGLF